MVLGVAMKQTKSLAGKVISYIVLIFGIFSIIIILAVYIQVVQKFQRSLSEQFNNQINVILASLEKSEQQLKDSGTYNEIKATFHVKTNSVCVVLQPIDFPTFRGILAHGGLYEFPQDRINKTQPAQLFHPGKIVREEDLESLVDHRQCTFL